MFRHALIRLRYRFMCWRHGICRRHLRKNIGAGCLLCVLEEVADREKKRDAFLESIK